MFTMYFFQASANSRMASDEKKRKLGECLPDLFAETLECPVCLETIKDPPIFLCEKGHELCDKCRDQLKAQGKPCPVCQGKLTDARCWAVEKMLEKLPKTDCKHEGCTFARSDAQRVKNHEEKECKLRQVQCISCQQPVAISRLYDHRLTDHNKTPGNFAGFGVETGIKLLKLTMTRNGLHSTYSQFPLQKVDNEIEFFYNWKRYDKTLIMFWISCCGTQKEAGKYDYSLKILGQDTVTCLFTGTRECVSADVSDHDMMADGGALLLNKTLLERAAGTSIDTDEERVHVYWTLMIKKK